MKFSMVFFLIYLTYSSSYTLPKEQPNAPNEMDLFNNIADLVSDWRGQNYQNYMNEVSLYTLQG